MVPIFSKLCHFLKIRFFGSIHSAGKLAMGGLGDHYITIQLNYFVKNIIIYKMAYRKSELYWMKLVFLQKNYIFLFLIEYFDIFRGKTRDWVGREQNIYIFRINSMRSTKWYLYLVYYVIF
jgi:hypothetical protein